MSTSSSFSPIQRARTDIKQVFQQNNQDEEKSWEQLWKTRITPWDAGEPSPVLVSVLEKPNVRLPGCGIALVPGCGMGYDVFAFARHGYQAEGWEISPTAIEKANEKQRELQVPPSRASIHHSDFFNCKPPHKFSIIYDYTFLCALPPSRRSDWAARMYELLDFDGILITLIFPVGDIADVDEGPPYTMTIDLVKSLVEGAGFKMELLEPTRLSIAKRQGKEYLGIWRKVGQKL